MEASRNGDVAGVLKLVTEDVIFMVPGQEPFGKQAFADMSRQMADVRVDGAAEIVELQVLGDWAFLRNRIDVTVTPPDGRGTRRSGYTLTLLRKETDGRWRLARDANLLAPEVSAE
jgi:uncharacterized protein (TIGR02246 family)